MVNDFFAVFIYFHFIFYLNRNLHKSPGQSIEVSRPKGPKEPVDKTASTMEEEDDDEEEDDEEDMEDDEDECDGSSWVDQFPLKGFLIMRLTSLVQAKLVSLTHQLICQQVVWGDICLSVLYCPSMVGFYVCMFERQDCSQEKFGGVF